ncbi:uncharacterized protein FA14DRAFT_182296 [Meira miltonrushii]|uniref:RRM domain-containing protein n=1 Tax=Meira miltonrushii TaxID=1280837 RepID=A0A316V4A7_9BASI|nr:uncharacterized protein FA14DRAFT_182296 [Meira miltonrushii]PWN32389.1 hypothetical protein FA14DRAFT_182296 [Meira miltonrushii]
MSRRPNSGNGRAQTQRIASGARANPYSRPGSASKQTSQQYPPNQLSIRGSSGPTWILIQNLLRGTSEADIQSTFQQFGKIEAVRSHPSSGSDQSLSFEVAFTHSTSAQGAIDKLNGALADGRVLNVRFRDNVPNKPANASGSKTSNPVQPPRAPARDIAAAAAAKANHGKELFPNKATPGAKNGSNPLGSRLMSATELKALSKKQAQQKKKAATPEGALSAPGFNQVSPSSAVALSKRIGSLPLALRLAETNAGSTANGKKKGSSGATLSASQKKRKRAQAKAANSSGMQLD